MKEQTNEFMNKWVYHQKKKWYNERKMKEKIDECMKKWVNERMNEGTNE